MFSNTALSLFNHESGILPINRRLRAYLQTSVLALACVAVAGPALAVTPYDGTWSVVINTRGGACEPSVRYALQIENGAVINPQANDVAVQGRVNRGGGVRVSVQSGNQWASGAGRLGRMSGSGVWRGQGNAGACQGTWVAQREGYGVAAAEGMGPIYNYAPGYNPAPGALMPVPGPEGSAVAWCAARFHSYNAATGTYLGIDGMRHPCP